MFEMVRDPVANSKPSIFMKTLTLKRLDIPKIIIQLDDIVIDSVVDTGG